MAFEGAVYCKKGGLRPVRCENHKKVDDVDLSAESEPRCEACDLVARCGTAYGSPRRCLDHRKDGGLDFSHRMCQHESCHKQASFGRPGGPPFHCDVHR